MFLDKPVTRRRAIGLAGVSALTLVTGIAFPAIGDSKSWLRPPGSLSETEFLARCIKCQRCLQVCPERIIVPLSLGQGGFSVSTPVLSFKKGHCSLCMECVSVCPTGAIQPLKRQDVVIGKAVIVKETCIAWDWEGCTQCAGRCPEKAIVLDSQNRSEVDIEKCNGCGLCENICPSSSLRAYNTDIQPKGIIVKPMKEKLL